MKKMLKYILLYIMTFIIGIINVQAKEMTSEEIPGNSYVIGTHVFTEKTTLLTKHIMLSSKTIKSNSLEDMIIYYKTPKGKWINGSDGSQLEVPEKFDINYIDLEQILSEFNINYILDGGTASNPLIYTSLTNDFTLVNPVKEGYVFLGWTGSNGNTPELEVKIKKGTTGDLEYTANWGLYGDIDNDASVETDDLVSIGQYLEEMIDFTKEQKLVADVNNDKVIDDVDAHILSKYISDGGTKPNGYNIKLPYNSGEKYLIKYNLNGGINDTRNPSVYAEISLSLTLEKPTKEGYVFLGWTGSNGDTPELEVTIENETTGNLEYTANWGLYGDLNNDDLVDSYDIVYLVQYLEEMIEFTTNQKLIADVNNDKVIDDVDAHILSKYISDGGTKPNGYNIKLPYNSGEKYLIKYNLNGGINDTRNPSVYAEISLSLTLEKPTKEGYVFLGWTGSNGDTPELEVTIENETTGNLEYTANWELKK